MIERNRVVSTKRRVTLVAGVATLLGIVGLGFVELKLEVSNKAAVYEMRQVAVPIGDCTVKDGFTVGSRQFKPGRLLLRYCKDVYAQLENPGDLIDAPLGTEEKRVLVSPRSSTSEIDWGANAPQLLFVFLGPAVVGAALTSLFLAIRKRGVRKIADVKFARLVTPSIMRGLYVVAICLVSIGFLVGWLGIVTGAYSDDGALRAYLVGLLSLPGLIVSAVIVLLVVRLIAESAIVRFRIADDLREIRDKFVQ